MHEHLKVLVTNIGDLTSYSFRRVAATVSALAERSEPETIALGGWIDRAMGMATSAARYNAQKSRQSDQLKIAMLFVLCSSMDAANQNRSGKIEATILSVESTQKLSGWKRICGYAEIRKDSQSRSLPHKGPRLFPERKMASFASCLRSNACRRLCNQLQWLMYIHGNSSDFIESTFGWKKNADLDLTVWQLRRACSLMWMWCREQCCHVKSLMCHSNPNYATLPVVGCLDSLCAQLVPFMRSKANLPTRMIQEFIWP